LRFIDFCISTDEVSFFDLWLNGTGVSFHIGKIRVDFCLPRLRYGRAKGQRSHRHDTSVGRDRDLKGP